ncbi:flagellar hook-basal body complex protein [Trinickia terrae]|uniref:Flagellar hook-basal body complex protein n=1 Tax=Trinickia terrae TaxID=2571161 RepID=A0A4U1I7R3_9BURK|nr:flagellar hook-basal body complex protein [Trinickia terrae]TKC89466.1 flagellar hook-basal body complex protein [Trinickia terrae]
MNNVFYIGATGLNAQQAAVDVTANNVANLNTPAFKRGAVSFAELLVPGTEPARRQSLAAGTVTAVGAGVAVAPQLHVFTAGELRQTGNALDIAIRGEGFIELASETRGSDAVIWRGGSLHVDTDGYLAAPNGMPLKAMISVPRDSTGLTIEASGQVFATVPNQPEPLEIGQIELVLPTDTRALQSTGDGAYRVRDDGIALTRARPGEDNAGALAQGFSEASNVSLSDELVSLMIYQRSYAANARLVQVGDELMAIANGLKR